MPQENCSIQESRELLSLIFFFHFFSKDSENTSLVIPILIFSMMQSQQFTKIGESWTRVDESAKIHGKALIPRISRNNNLYTKKELKRFDNVTVPMNWEHDPSKVIGTATFLYNEELETVFYEGEITDDAAANLARNRILYTSIEANPRSATTFCNGPDDCMNVPKDMQPVALALTETPGIPETSVNLLESYLKECKEDQELEKKYAPQQTNLNNEEHIAKLLAKQNEKLETLQKDFSEFKNSFCPDCGKFNHS